MVEVGSGKDAEEDRSRRCGDGEERPVEPLALAAPGKHRNPSGNDQEQGREPVEEYVQARYEISRTRRGRCMESGVGEIGEFFDAAGEEVGTPEFSQAQVRNIVAASEFEGVNHQACPGRPQGAMGKQVDKEGQSRDHARGHQRAHFTAHISERGPGLLSGFEFDGQVAKPGRQRREHPVVLFEADREGEQCAHPSQVTAPTFASEGKQALGGGEGQDDGGGGVESESPGGEGPDGKNQQPRDRAKPPSAPRQRGHDAVAHEHKGDEEAENQEPRGDHAGTEERENPGQGEPHARRDECIHFEVEHATIEQVQGLLEEIAFVREDDGAPAKRPAESQGRQGDQPVKPDGPFEYAHPPKRVQHSRSI